MKEKLLGKRISGILNLVVILLSLFCIVFYTIMALGVKEFNNMVDIYLVLAILFCIVYLFVDNYIADIANLVSVVFLTLVIGKLIVSSINTFADAMNGISMFGSSGEIKHIIISAIVMAVALILEIVSCFMSRDKKAAKAVKND